MNDETEEVTESVVVETAKAKTKTKKKEVKGADADATTKTKAVLAEDDQVQVMIPSTEKDKLPVPVIVNGVKYKIERDKWKAVPQAVIHVLENAKVMKARPVKEGNNIRMETYEVQRFAFSTKS